MSASAEAIATSQTHTTVVLTLPASGAIDRVASATMAPIRMPAPAVSVTTSRGSTFDGCAYIARREPGEDDGRRGAGAGGEHRQGAGDDAIGPGRTAHRATADGGTGHDRDGVGETDPGEQGRPRAGAAGAEVVAPSDQAEGLGGTQFGGDDQGRDTEGVPHQLRPRTSHAGSLRGPEPIRDPPVRPQWKVSSCQDCESFNVDHSVHAQSVAPPDNGMDEGGTAERRTEAGDRHLNGVFVGTPGSGLRPAHLWH